MNVMEQRLAPYPFLTLCTLDELLATVLLFCLFVLQREKDRTCPREDPDWSYPSSPRKRKHDSTLSWRFSAGHPGQCDFMCDFSVALPLYHLVTARLLLQECLIHLSIIHLHVRWDAHLERMASRLALQELRQTRSGGESCICFGTKHCV